MRLLAASWVILTTFIFTGASSPVAQPKRVEPIQSWEIKDLQVSTNEFRVRTMSFTLIPSGEGEKSVSQHCQAQWIVGAIPVSGLSQPFECAEEGTTKTYWQPSENLMNMDPARERWQLAISKKIQTDGGCMAFEGHIEMMDIGMKDGWPNDTDPVLLTNCTEDGCTFYGGKDSRGRFITSTTSTQGDCEKAPGSLFR